MKAFLLTKLPLVFGSLALGMILTGGVSAEENTAVKPVVSADMIRHAISSERKVLFEEGMDLKPEDKDAFWDIYEKFNKEKGKLAEKRIRLLGEYIENYVTMTPKKTNALLKQSSKNQMVDLKIRKKYTNMIARKINPTVAGRFYQIDDFVTSTVRITLLANLPMFGEMVD